MAQDRFPWLLSRLALIATAGIMLASCASASVDESTFFANPAKYDLYDCKQLSEARKIKAARIDELTRLMAKAQSGVGGEVMSELGYRSDYVLAQADLKVADRVWQQNRCDTQILSTSPGRQPASALPATASGGRIY